MVASIGAVAAPAQGASYYERDGYYAKDDPAHKDASAWAGKGAAELGLEGPVDPDTFRAVLEGRVPDGSDTRLGRRGKDGEITHRPGRDLTLSAPKSVSLAALVGGDARVTDAHDRAVARTLDWFERNVAETRMRDPENYMRGDVVAFHRPYKRLGVDKSDELRVAGVNHKTRTVNLEGADGRSAAWEPSRVAARAGGVEVYRSEEIEIRAGDRIRWTRNDAGLGLVNSGTAEVAAVRDGRVTFRLEDGRTLDLAPGDPQLRHIDRAWASTVHAFQGRTVDTVIAAMEANHPHLTTQKSFYVEISRARDRAELVTDDREALKEQLEAVTGERIAALEAVKPEKAKGREAGMEAGQSPDRESGGPVSRERSPKAGLEQDRGAKVVDRDLGL